MDTQRKGYEYWNNGIQLKVRCSCWRHLLQPIETVSGIGWIADYNGWYPIDHPYPHAPNCPHK